MARLGEKLNLALWILVAVAGLAWDEWQARRLRHMTTSRVWR